MLAVAAAAAYSLLMVHVMNGRSYWELIHFADELQDVIKGKAPPSGR